MKTLLSESARILAISVASVLCLLLATRPAQAAEKAAGTEYPSVIQPEMGAAEFAQGDSIIITSVRGDREHLKPGGRYALDGSYTLASAETADLEWFATSRGRGGSTPVSDAERVKVTRGSGNFHLEKTLLDDGWLHVSFCVNSQLHGGIYFGEKGLEGTVLREKSWSDFSSASPGNGTEQDSAAARNGETSAPTTANREIMAFLGDPVLPPAGLDKRYTPTNLKVAFTDLCRRLGLTVERLEVDESEFPYVIYGLLAGQCDYHVIADGIRELNGYSYGGSVSGSTQAGGTYFSLNAIPETQFPRGRLEDCNRRLMVRLQMLADSMRSGTFKPASRIEVVFDNPESYTDRRLSFDADWYHEDIFSAIRSFLVKLTDQMLPDGYSLKITFTDIDLGHRDSSHVPAASGSPAFEFTYSVTDASGAVVKHGTENLRHYWDFGNYLPSVGTADTAGIELRFEKAMLKEWADTRLADLKKR